MADTNNHVIRTIDAKSGKVGTLQIAGLAPPTLEEIGARQAALTNQLRKSSLTPSLHLSDRPRRFNFNIMHSPGPPQVQGSEPVSERNDGRALP